MTVYLVDKSAYEQQRHSQAADSFLTAITLDGQAAMCEIVALELLYSTRNPTEYARRSALLTSLPWLAVNHRVVQTALELQGRLAERGLHRRPIPDLLIAATALVHGATVLHYDKDFDLIAGVTGQSTQWIVPRGSGHSASRT